MKIMLAALAVAAVMLAGCTSSGGGNDSGGGFVAKVQQDSTTLAQQVTELIAEAGAADPSDLAAMTQVAGDAQELHGHLNDFHSAIAVASNTSNDDQLLMFTGEGHIRDAVGAVNKWTSDPNASNSASWQRQMGTGVAEWNHAVTVIWSKAAAGTAPTVSLPAS